MIEFDAIDSSEFRGFIDQIQLVHQAKVADWTRPTVIQQTGEIS